MQLHLLVCNFQSSPSSLTQNGGLCEYNSRCSQALLCHVSIPLSQRNFVPLLCHPMQNKPFPPFPHTSQTLEQENLQLTLHKHSREEGSTHSRKPTQMAFAGNSLLTVCYSSSSVPNHRGYETVTCPSYKHFNFSSSCKFLLDVPNAQ